MIATAHGSRTDSSGQLVRLLAAGAAAGLLIGLLLSWSWFDSGQGTTVSVLGAGSSVTVLISHDQRRVLIASGTNGAEFSNAISDVLPPLGDEIDVLLIHPAASPDVIERARRLDHRRLMMLPDPDGDSTLETIQESFQISLGEDIQLSLRVGPDLDWAATLDVAGSRVLITPHGSPVRTVTASVWIILEGGPEPIASMSSAITIGPAGGTDETITRHVVIASGEVASMTLDDGRISMPASLIDDPGSDQ